MKICSASQIKTSVENQLPKEKKCFSQLKINLLPDDGFLLQFQTNNFLTRKNITTH